MTESQKASAGKNSLWILWTFTFVLNWVAFLYIGTRAKRPSWWLAGAVYATPMVLLAVLSDEALLADVLAVAVLGLASIVHAFLVRGKYIELIHAEQEQKLRKYQSLQELIEQDQEVVATTAAATAPGRAGGGSMSTAPAARKAGGSASSTPAARKTVGSVSTTPAAGKTVGSESTTPAEGEAGGSVSASSAAEEATTPATTASAETATAGSVEAAPAELAADSADRAAPASLETTQTASAEEIPSAPPVLELPAETQDVPAPPTPPTPSKPQTMTQKVDAFVLEDVEDSSRHAAPASRADIQIINLNTATAEEIGSLPGIGLLLGMTAVSIRETKGRFASLEQFVDVIGLKPHVADRLRPYVIL